MKKNIGHIDWLILLPVVGIMLYSIAFVYSASATFAEWRLGGTEKLFWSHAVKVFIGIVIILIFAKIDYHKYHKLSLVTLLSSIALLIAVFFFGSAAKGASRWLDLGFLRFQPSEVVKFAMVLHFAVLLDEKKEYIKDFKAGFLPFIIWTGGICLLIALQPNFSTMMVIYLIAVAMMFIGNVNLIHLGSLFLLGLFTAGAYAVSAQYRMNRFLAYLGMGGSKTEAVSYQLNQALLALGNGGLLGVGPGQNRQSHLFLPESYGDFIFSIIGEDMGFIGLTIIIAAFMLIFWRGMIIAKKAPDDFGYFLAIGIIITFAFYVFVNAGVNTGLLPTTGVPLPLISYGGTAIWIYAAAVGVLLNISAQANVLPMEKNIKINDFNDSPIEPSEAE